MLTRENTITELKDSAIQEHSGITFMELAFVKKINIRGSPSDNSFMSLSGKILEAVLPIKPNTYTNNGKIRILWLGPNEWLIVDENPNENNELISKLENIDNREESSITDISDNRTVIRIAGKKLFTLLSKFLVLDLDNDHVMFGLLSMKKMNQHMQHYFYLVLFHLFQYYLDLAIMIIYLMVYYYIFLS